MDANTQIDKLISTIGSLQDNIDGLQSHIDTLKQTHENFIKNANNIESTPHPDIESKIQTIKGSVIERSIHIENLINNVLHPDVIQKRIDNINKIEQRKKYWNEQINKQDN